LLLALAALIGLIAGWLIWGGQADTGRGFGNGPPPMRYAALDKVDRAGPKPAIRGDIQRCKVAATCGRAGAAPLTAQVVLPDRAIVDMPADDAVRPVPTAQTTRSPLNPATVGKLKASSRHDGLPDDRRRSKASVQNGNALQPVGFWHYDQIAAWNADEISGSMIQSFKGRVTVTTG
jgi:hypothetical protein